MTAKDRFDFLTEEYGYLKQISMAAYQEAVTHWYDMEVQVGSLTVSDLMGDAVWLCELLAEREKEYGLSEKVEGDSDETENKTGGAETEGSA